MRRVSKEGREPLKARRRKAGTLKRRNGLKTARRRSTSAASRETKVARLTRELKEALEQQSATSEVLKVISRPAVELQSVFDAVVESATHLCAAADAFIFLRDGELLRVAARYGFSPEFQEYTDRNPVSLDRGSAVGRSAIEGRVIHIPDVLADPEYTYLEHQKISGYRAVLGAPLLQNGSVVGVIFVARKVPQPFTPKQIELVSTFANQAVIAIENVRLLKAEQQRSRELTESLHQQTATADVLKVISRSTFDLRTVLQTLVESAARLCEADKGTITRQIGEVFYRAESYGFSSEFMESVRNIPVVPERGSAHGRALLDRTIVPTFKRIPNIPSCKGVNWATIALSLEFRCCARACRSAVWR